MISKVESRLFGKKQKRRLSHRKRRREQKDSSTKTFVKHVVMVVS
jgi:hypothetical protein